VEIFRLLGENPELTVLHFTVWAGIQPPEELGKAILHAAPEIVERVNTTV
jgi:hypothetical protein